MSLHSSLMVDQMNIYNTTSLQFVHGLLQTVHRWIHWNLSRRSCFRQTHQKRNRQKSMGRQTGRTVCRSFETRSCQADLTGSPWEIPCTYTIRSKPSVYIWHTQNVKSYQCLSSFLSTAWITFQPTIIELCTNLIDNLQYVRLWSSEICSAVNLLWALPMILSASAEVFRTKRRVDGR